ncbi:uncharacterized protein N7498_008946 [Penicillium cinerascens]|uniref:Uncharacterized protein n=1 Tax=Penicillium cinerascens TaxID=70096 RepID=A0A9W9JEH7_9EURO|nr:uncharacterized protein N7498_008946 [Penicillium cinerascens]KAJ5195508.1 hypothetical protein N7498_008946 [Penicillium cinerascens]
MKSVISSSHVTRRTQLLNPLRLVSTSRPFNTSIPLGKSSDLKNPISSSPESQHVNASRSLGDRMQDTPDTRSAQSPVAKRDPLEKGSEAHAGEEQTSTDAQIKNDPKKPAEAKRKNVENAGQKPMGPEDHQ